MESGLRKCDNIILIGYRGTGKSLVSKELAERTGRQRISLDAVIEKKYGAINGIVSEFGWQRFRQIETEILQSIKMTRGIIDCGGGIIEGEKNIGILKTMGQVFWLKASVKVIQNRLAQATDRPALTSTNDFLEEVEQVLTRRQPLYQKAADFAIDTDYKLPRTITEEILKYCYIQ